MARLLRPASMSAAFAVLLTLGGMRAARADLIRTVPFMVIGPGTTTIALPQFNPARGTLNAATITETAADQFVLEIFNSGAGGSYQATAQNTFTFGLGGPPQPGIVNASGTIPANTMIFTPMPPPVQLGPLMLLFGPGSDSFLVGTGTIDTSVSLSDAAVTGFSGSTISGVLAFAAASGLVTVDYAFTPAVVPEPGSGLLLISGLALLAGTAARRHHRFSRTT